MRPGPAGSGGAGAPGTFVAVLHLPQVDLGDGLEVHVPQPDAAVPSSGGEALLAGVHAEDPGLGDTGTRRGHGRYRDRSQRGSEDPWGLTP